MELYCSFNPGVPAAITDKPAYLQDRKKKDYESRKGGGSSGSVSCRLGGGCTDSAGGRGVL
jgi:hypothetical protein